MGLKPAFRKLTGLDDRVEYVLDRTKNPHVIETIGQMRVLIAKLRTGDRGAMLSTIEAQAAEIARLKAACEGCFRTRPVPGSGDEAS